MTSSPPSRRCLLIGSGILALPAPAALAVGEATGTLGRILRSGIVRIGVWLDAPPWGGYSHDGSPDGSEVALARLLARDLGVRLRLQRLAARDRIDALDQDLVDLLVALLPITPTTRRRVAFAAPHGQLGVVVAARRGSSIRSLQDLAGRRVALPDNTFAAEEMRQRLPPDTTALFLPDMIACVDAAAHGRADAAVIYDWLLRDLSISRPDLALEGLFTVSHTHTGMATRLGEHDLIRFLNTFIYLRTADGMLAEIHERYLRATPPVGPVFR